MNRWTFFYVVAVWLFFFVAPNVSYGWDVGTDVNGMKYLRQTDNELSIITAFGYDDSKDCTDLKFVSINGYPKEYSEIDLPENNILIYMGKKTLQLGAQKPAKLVSGDVVAFVYKHTPNIRMITEFMNHEGMFFWKDASMDPGTYARFLNTGFTDKINEVIQSCHKRFGEKAFPSEPTEEKEGQSL